MIAITTQATPFCSCSAMHTDLECVTHGEMMQRSLWRDRLWRRVERVQEKARIDVICLQRIPIPEMVVMRTPAEWSEMEGMRIIDPDGWRSSCGLRGEFMHYDPRSFDDPIDIREWRTRMCHSTCTMPKRMLEEAKRNRESRMAPRPKNLRTSLDANSSSRSSSLAVRGATARPQSPRRETHQEMIAKAEAAFAEQAPITSARPTLPETVGDELAVTEAPDTGLRRGIDLATGKIIDDPDGGLNIVWPDGSDLPFVSSIRPYRTDSAETKAMHASFRKNNPVIKTIKPGTPLKSTSIDIRPEPEVIDAEFEILPPPKNLDDKTKSDEKE